MSRSSELSHRGRVAALTGALLAACTGALLQLPLGASAGIAAGGGELTPPPGSPLPSVTATQRTLNNYQLRCWQYGRLLFDESAVSLPADARVGARLVALDRHGAPLIVTDAGGVTCLARAAGAAPSTALPR